MIPESINDLSDIAINNVPQGGDNVGGTLDDILRAIQAIMKRDLALKSAEAAAGTSFVPAASLLSKNVQAALAELAGKVNAISPSSIGALEASKNLSDVSNKGTARSNLGLGDAAIRWPTWAEVTGKPSSFAPSSHTHTWSQVTGAPATATRWPTWSEVTSKPSLVETSRSISTGTGLAGGGNLSANRTLSIDSTYSPNTSRSLSSENLNDLKTPGFYHQTANANALTSRNYPTQQAGTLVVTHAAGVVQEYTCYSSGNKYYRGFYSTSWGVWKRVVVDTDSIAWSRITGAPVHATRANTWGEVTSKPATATRWPSWSEVTSKPSTFSPSSHNHSAADITSGTLNGARMPTGHGGVGTYAWVQRNVNGTTTWGQTIAGSNISAGGSSLAGTWRVMSAYINMSGLGPYTYTNGLAVRIS